MNWLENLLIVAGISLDIFAGMECQGSLVKKINKKLKNKNFLKDFCFINPPYKIVTSYHYIKFSR